jgi:selenide,water dikinase
LHDPQTSGGLLAAVAPAQVAAFFDYCGARGQEAWIIGEALEGEGIEIV